MSDDLTEKLRQALRTPNVSFELDRNLFGGQALLRITVPGKTPRSKRVQPVPLIVGEEGQTHADLLRHLANAFLEIEGATEDSE